MIYSKGIEALFLSFVFFDPVFLRGTDHLISTQPLTRYYNTFRRCLHSVGVSFSGSVLRVLERCFTHWYNSTLVNAAAGSGPSWLLIADSFGPY